MKNINKNAVQALCVDGKAFLTHKAIDSFTMGQGDFTIEVSFICNEVRDCLFYAQEQGFAFGIRNGLLYFELDGLGSITQKEGVDIVTDVLLSAAVSCREGKLSLYFEGLPIADQVEVTSGAAENSGTYEIGKGLKGYLVELRLRSCGMMDQEILSDNGMGLTDCESIEFWTDFTSVQYRDKSPNALGLSTMQGIVKCVNVTSCTSLELQGGYVTMAKRSYGEAYTLLFKIYPQLESYTKMYVYSAVGADGTIFSIGVELDSEGDKQIFVENGGVVYQGNSALPLMAWTDIGLRVENGNAQLYIDGVRQLEFVFSGKLDNITSIIGVKPFEKKIVCKDGFWGYLDYFAEFDCALSEEKIAYYAEEQPYIFDESINSLYAFYCGDPIDLLTGNMLLSIGSGKAVFEKELNNLSAPIGMDLRVPQEVCKEWQELSEYEQWAITTAMDMVRETYSQSMGYITPEGIVPIEQAATKRMGQHYEEEIEEVATVWTPENQDDKANKFIRGSLSRGTGGVGLAVAGLVVMGGTGAAAVGGVTATKFATMGTAAAAAAGGAAAIGGTWIAMRRKLSEDEAIAKKKMPKNDDGDLQLISVCCNHNGKPETGSIHFHSDAELTKPDSMTYICDEDFSIDLLLITSKLDNVIAECKLYNNSKKQISGTFGISSGCFSSEKEKFSIAPQSYVTVNIKLTLMDKICHNLAEYRNEMWEFCNGDIVICTCITNIFLLENLPIAPWETHVGEEYFVNCMAYPPLCFIKNMITDYVELNGYLDTKLTDIPLRDNIKEQFNILLNQIYEKGRLKYVYVAGFIREGLFDIQTFLKYITSDKSEITVNCEDCANIVSLIAAMLSIKMHMNLIVGINSGDFGFECNYMMLIPKDIWKSGERGFAYHQVAFYSEKEDFDKTAEIYDLCLKIDKGNYPSKNMEKEAFLSGGYKAYDKHEIPIQIDEPYEKEVYLERLVKNGQVASFLSAYFTAEFYYNNELGEKPNELYVDLMQRFIQFYGLDNEKYAVEIPQPEMNPSFLQEMRIENRSESQYECEWSVPDGIRVTWFRNAEHLPAGEYLASVLMHFSCRLAEKEAPELGERVFYGPDLLITYFEGSAYAINCKDMAKAVEMAHNLKNSMI